ncbi:MAG: hypothetical protein MJ076_03770 [Clostridia bacterium]|nr:hypothetical protein [Clostridia bacterium]
MDELSSKLAEILNDPESMGRVKKMAESLLAQPQENEPVKNQSDITTMLQGDGMPDIKDMQKIMQILSHLKSAGNNNRTALLLALKPNLSEPKREKVDTAIKILKLIEILPFLKESGIFNL